jgi:hypothetical protein
VVAKTGRLSSSCNLAQRLYACLGFTIMDEDSARLTMRAG